MGPLVLGIRAKVSKTERESVKKYKGGRETEDSKEMENERE